MKIAIDFDGTCVTHEYPNVGKDIGAVPVLKELVAAGHQLILYTMRSGEQLTAAIQWFTDNDIRLYAVGKDPDQDKWTDSDKCYAELYIDDAALGCPLTVSDQVSNRAFVNWVAVHDTLIFRGYMNRDKQKDQYREQAIYPTTPSEAFKSLGPLNSRRG